MGWAGRAHHWLDWCGRWRNSRAAEEVEADWGAGEVMPGDRAIIPSEKVSNVSPLDSITKTNRRGNLLGSRIIARRGRTHIDRTIGAFHPIRSLCWFVAE